jgi:hypothetical protein
VFLQKDSLEPNCLHMYVTLVFLITPSPIRKSV